MHLQNKQTYIKQKKPQNHYKADKKSIINTLSQYF